MCPACITTLALVAAGTGSAGGLTALVVRKIGRRNKGKSRDEQAHAKSTETKEKP